MAAAAARKAAPARRRAAARTAPARGRAAPARRPRPAPARGKAAPARRPRPARRRTAPARRRGGQLIPLAVGTAGAVGRLPDSTLIVRLTRGRAWIGVLGALLAGIVALNVLTLSFAATAGRIDRDIQVLDRENSVLRARDAQRTATARVRREALDLGLAALAVDEVGHVKASAADARRAARRLEAAAYGP